MSEVIRLGFFYVHELERVLIATISPDKISQAQLKTPSFTSPPPNPHPFIAPSHPPHITISNARHTLNTLSMLKRLLNRMLSRLFGTAKFLVLKWCYAVIYLLGLGDRIDGVSGMLDGRLKILCTD